MLFALCAHRLHRPELLRGQSSFRVLKAPGRSPSGRRRRARCPALTRRVALVHSRWCALMRRQCGIGAQHGVESGARPQQQRQRRSTLRPSAHHRQREKTRVGLVLPGELWRPPGQSAWPGSPSRSVSVECAATRREKGRRRRGSRTERRAAKSAATSAAESASLSSPRTDRVRSTAATAASSSRSALSSSSSDTGMTSQVDNY
jgi:hypothetical protein